MTRDGDEGFFSRWSRRKSEVREQQKPQTSQTPLAPQTPQDGKTAQAKPVDVFPASAIAPENASLATKEGVTPGTRADGEDDKPTLAETESLTPASDFSRFVKKDVSSDVRNAAVKKLFADPHFNVMDGLDIYIDDYTQTEPIPAAMMAKMVGAQFLKLVEDPADQATKAAGLASQASAPEGGATTDSIDGVGETDPDLTRQNKTEVPAPDAEQPIAKTHESHDNPDLQLQPNHSAGRQGAG